MSQLTISVHNQTLHNGMLIDRNIGESASSGPPNPENRLDDRHGFLYKEQLALDDDSVCPASGREIAQGTLQGFVQAFVRIELHGPRGRDGEFAQSEVPLIAESAEFPLHHMHAVFQCDIEGVIRAEAIDQENFLGKPLEVLQRLTEIVALVQGN